MPARPFFDVALPTTSRALLAGMRGERLLKVMSEESRVKASESQKRNLRVFRARGGESLRRAKLAAQAAAVGLSNLHDGHRRSDWDVVKPTHNK